jgi:hypothetical protein
MIERRELLLAEQRGELVAGGEVGGGEGGERRLVEAGRSPRREQPAGPVDQQRTAHPRALATSW